MTGHQHFSLLLLLPIRDVVAQNPKHPNETGVMSPELPPITPCPSPPLLPSLPQVPLRPITTTEVGGKLQASHQWTQPSSDKWICATIQQILLEISFSTWGSVFLIKVQVSRNPRSHSRGHTAASNHRSHQRSLHRSEILWTLFFVLLGAQEEWRLQEHPPQSQEAQCIPSILQVPHGDAVINSQRCSIWGFPGISRPNRGIPAHSYSTSSPQIPPVCLPVRLSSIRGDDFWSCMTT